MTTANRRLFLALWPDAELRARLVELQARLPGQRGRWVHGEDLHLTLRFLGSMPAGRMACIGQAAQAVQAAPVAFDLDRIEYWARPRILCLTGQAPEALRALVTALEASLRACRFEPETRPYRPHVTLLRKARPMEPVVLETPLEWTADHFVLVESRPGGTPPHYRVLEGWPLGKV